MGQAQTQVRRYCRNGNASIPSGTARVFLDVTTVLRPQYAIAVAAIPDESGDVATDLQRHLAEHLMLMYWHGQLGSAPYEDKLLADFLHDASTEVRKRGLAFVGHRLRDMKDSVPQDVKARLMRLWDECIQDARASARSDMSELQAFGWWITSDVFDFLWIVPRAVEVLELARGIDSQGEVIASLSHAPPSTLASAVKVLRLIVANDREGWSVFGHQEDARALLRAAAQTQDPETIEEARTAADLLIARGFSEFRGVFSEFDPW